MCITEIKIESMLATDVADTLDDIYERENDISEFLDDFRETVRDWEY